MQNTTADYKIEINKPSRSFECKITIGNNIYTNEDLVNLTLEYTQPQEGFSIGGTISKSLDLTLLNKGDIIYSTSQIKIEIGLKIGSTIEYILMGIFNIDDIEKTDYTTKFTCYDNMIKFETAYFSNLGDKPKLQQVVSELSSKTGVEFTGSLPVYTVSKLDGFSCREVLSYVASICGGNAFITRDGKFTIKNLSEVEKAIDGNNYFDYKREEVKYKIGQISCQVDENNILSKGSLGADSMELGFENPWVTETILTEIYNKLKSVEYLGYSMKWQGDLSLDPYDIITVTDVKNVVRKIPILSQKITYTGGLTSEIGAKGETKNKNSFSSSGSTTNKVNRLVTEQAIIKEALIEKANIKDLEAVSIRTQTLEAKTAKIEEAIIDVAHIKDLNAINANIQNLIAADATINNALIGKADITELNAVKGTINVLESDTANIKNLLAGNITGESGQLIHLTASNVVIADAVIKDLIAANISAQDLKASTISTTKFRIASDNGGIEIVGATQQFKDKNNKVRIQMGQDTKGNFNFILRGEDGTTTLIDHTGIKEKAIADNLIKENMVAADAIGEKQINYSSLITGLNKDTNTSLIKASKVAIDLTGQSLEVSFNSLKSNVDNMEIGGRNLLRNSNVDRTTTRFLNIYVKDILSPYIGREICVSFDCKINSSGIERPIQMYKYQGSGISIGNSLIFTPTKEYKRFTLVTRVVESSVPSGYSEGSIAFYDSAGENNYTVKNIKIELGNKPTDYTVAPEDLDQKIESNTTAITVAQGKIDALVSENTIIKGDVTTISNKYTSLKATVGGINTTVASHTSSIGTINTSISGLSGKVTAVENKYASLSQNLEGFKTTVGNTYSTKSELSTVDGKVTSLNSRVSTAESSITQLNNEIALKVEATDVTEAINNVSIGGRNLLLGTSENERSVNRNFDYRIATGIEKDSYYTYSGWLKANRNTRVSIYVNDDTGQNRVGFYFPSVELTTEYKKVEVTAYSTKGNTNTDNIIMRVYGAAGDIITGKKAKLEKGTKATDYIKAIEDVDASIVSVDSKVTTTNNKVATIETNLNSITSRVSSTESTVATHTTQLGQVDTKISTAKSDAISTASSDATSKANSALTSAKNYTDGQITTVNQTITDKVAEIKLTTDSITQRVSSTESTLTSTTTIANTALNSINNLSIGGRNLLRNSEKERTTTRFIGINVYDILSLYVGEEICVSFDCKINDGGIERPIKMYKYQDSGISIGNTLTFTPTKSYKRFYLATYVHESSIPSGYTKGAIGFYDYAGNNNYTIKNVKIELGNKSTDWTPAPEDIDSAISTVDTKVTTTSNKVATIETNLNSITSRVSSTESSITTINGNVTSLQSRMTTAEQKITPTAITTTISSVITGGTGSISTTQFVMDKNGLTINNGALTIKNKSGTTVLNSDTNGNLVITGEMRSQYGQQWVGLNAGGLTFQDWNRNEQMLRVGLSYFESNRDMNGVNFALAKYGDFIRFSHIAKTDLTNGWSPSDTQYNFFDCWSGDQSVNGVAFKKGINVYAPMYVNSNGILFNNDSNFTSDIRGATWNTMTNLLGIFGDNGLSLGYRNGSAYEARIVMTEGSHPGTDDKIKSWGHWNGSGYVLHNFEVRATALSVSGSKNCIQKTESYGERLINAYETAEYYFGDLGFGKINSDGECLVYIDDIFLECVNTNSDYHVFTQIYNGKITSIERYKTYFIVKGDPGTSFSWELKAKRIGYENNRLDTPDIETQSESGIELFSDEDFKIKTSENTLMDIITYSLEDLLMEG